MSKKTYCGVAVEDVGPPACDSEAGDVSAGEELDGGAASRGRVVSGDEGDNNRKFTTSNPKRKHSVAERDGAYKDRVWAAF